MDYLQYFIERIINVCTRNSFKPYYKWITFNTKDKIIARLKSLAISVLNLIINGLPSILNINT